MSGLAIGVVEAAMLLGSHPETVRRHVRKGTIPHFRLGKKIVIARETINRMLAGERVRAAS